ncbi:uncharacterized protein Ecym_6371 [Eremothecium cymbalariae DBVPG|uniref:Uncharacterized protein n=1 Tax=Eremothecium cymbalariae (strain CBS 270.75 / DBVPG 7215 / KCTC 17166 / NRRL Y-17582) TaxID=931890 RepID=G8JUG6_ERECY|nr:hypothetical protein Ecym_6371 [Eremothecium cymbalariae DBVPG\
MSGRIFAVILKRVLRGILGVPQLFYFPLCGGLRGRRYSVFRFCSPTRSGPCSVSWSRRRAVRGRGCVPKIVSLARVRRAHAFPAWQVAPRLLWGAEMHARVLGGGPCSRTLPM